MFSGVEQAPPIEVFQLGREFQVGTFGYSFIQRS